MATAVESVELFGSEGAAAENKLLKKRRMQAEENISSVAAVPLCRDDKGSGKKRDWMQTGIHLSLNTNSNTVGAHALHEQRHIEVGKKHGNEKVWVYSFKCIMASQSHDKNNSEMCLQ